MGMAYKSSSVCGSSRVALRYALNCHQVVGRVTAVERIDIKQKIGQVQEPWCPGIVAEANGQHIKVARFLGAYPWHAHADADEVFLVVEGEFIMEFRAHQVALTEGQMIVVPRGVEHRPVAATECCVLLFEPAGTVSTGDAQESELTSEGMWI